MYRQRQPNKLSFGLTRSEQRRQFYFKYTLWRFRRETEVQRLAEAIYSFKIVYLHSSERRFSAHQRYWSASFLSQLCTARLRPSDSLCPSGSGPLFFFYVVVNCDSAHSAATVSKLVDTGITCMNIDRIEENSVEISIK